MWIADDGKSVNCLMVDLGQLCDKKCSQIVFDKNESLWKYKIECSSDRNQCEIVVDLHDNMNENQVQSHHLIYNALL